MNANKKTIGLNNGWILCPSKSFPGKFYYFNVLNGEAAWSLNEADKKGLRKESGIHRVANKSHDYPEPTTLPDDTSIVSTLNIGSNYRKTDFQTKNIPYTQHLPTFGQTGYPYYLPNVEPLMPNIVWTPIQLPVPMFCPNRMPMIDEVTQTSELQREIFTHTCNIPLCKRFKNYEQPYLSFDKKNKIVNKMASKFVTSTPLKKPCAEISSEFENGITKSKSSIKDTVTTKCPDSKFQEMSICNEYSTIIPSDKIENSNSKIVSNTVQKVESFDKLDRSDLRFLLLAKRRKSVDFTDDTVVERKKPKPTIDELKTQKKKVTFDLSNVYDTVMISTNEDQDLMSLTNQFTPKSPPVPHTTTEKNIDIKNNVHTTYLTPKTETTSPNIESDTYRVIPRPVVKREHNTLPLKSDTWFIVADTDVLLLDYEVIDNLVLSDSKCKLLIPHAVRADLEGLCIGDCKGQQRVINARQLTRRLVSPPAHYTVEPPPEHDTEMITTENILNCCLQAMNANYYVVLITNDPHLQIKAKSLSIANYKLSDIKNGAKIKPDISTEKNGANIKLDLSIENKKCDNKNNLDNINVDTVKKQLFFNEDKIINITKRKCLKHDDNIAYDNNASNINQEIQNSKEKTILKPQNNNPFISKTIKDTFINFEKKILNENALENTLNLKKTIFNLRPDRLNFESCFPKLNNEEINYNRNEPLNNEIKNAEQIFCSIPISNLKELQFQSKNLFENQNNFKNVAAQKYLISSGFLADTKNPDMCLSSHHDPAGICRENKVLTPTQSRIKKIFNTINSESATNTKFENHDTSGIFKIPQLLQFKNRTKNTSALTGSKNRTQKFKTIDTVDESVKRFCIKNKIMGEKLRTRIDEWICIYTQIMEDVLNNLLQKNRKYFKDTMAPLTLHDTLNCIKMLYDSHPKIRELIDKLSEFLNKSVCEKGKLKPSLRPDDFMKMLGYGVLLIQALQNILPLSEELTDAESRLSQLLVNLERDSQEYDPELLKAPVFSRTELEGRDEEMRPNFVKDPLYVFEYLKKHFIQWKSYKGDFESLNCNFNSQSADYKVLRTFGKHLNMLKIDNTKTISLTKNITEGNNLKNKDAKLIRLLDNQPFSKSVEEKFISKENQEGLKTMKLLNNEENIFLSYARNENDKKKGDLQNFTDENEMLIDNIQRLEITDHNTNNQTVTIEANDLLTQGTTFTQNTEENEPKIITDINQIDAYEKKSQNKESLDLDVLDYSEIYEPSINEISENLQFDITSKNGDLQEKHNVNNDNTNYRLTDTACTLEGFTQDVRLDTDDAFYGSRVNNHESDNESFIFNTGKRITKSPNAMNCLENYDFHGVPKINNENHADGNNCTSVNETYNENNGPHNDASHNDIYDKNVQTVRDDNTNDSGFENDSTYAHSVVKIFLNELSTTFKVIYDFVNKFVIEIRGTDLCEIRMNKLHSQASKSLEDMVVIIQRLRSIMKRESAEDTVLKTLLLNAGVEAVTDKRMTRYRQIVRKCLEQAQILENALRIIVSTTIGDFDAISTNAESINSSIRYFNIFE